MPLLGGKELEKIAEPADLKDDDLLFYLEETKEIFTDYEEYFTRKMLMNTTVWRCTLTGRRNLTFAEAVESERQARKCLKQFNEDIKTPIIFLTTLTKRVSVNEMLDDIFTYLNPRYAKNEIVLALNSEISKKNFIEARVIKAIGPTGSATSPVDPANIRYKLKRLDPRWELEWTASADEIHRPRYTLTRSKLKLFLAQCVEPKNDGLLVLKDDLKQKYLTEKNIKKFNDLFIGKVPVFGASKSLGKDNRPTKRTPDKDKDKKQTSISTFFAKNNNQTEAAENPSSKLQQELEEKEKAKSFLEEMNRIKELERQKKIAEEKFNSYADAKIKLMNLMQEDLQLQDQKPFPALKPVQSLIPARYFGDALMIQEFIYSFSTLLEDKDKFPYHIHLSLMERALMCREVAGPLSDIVQVLLGSIFSLQVDEENDNRFWSLAKVSSIPLTGTLNVAMSQATKAASWSKNLLSMRMNELPMDAMSVSELLRIHLLMSGAKLDDSSENSRFQRRGYRNIDDPGLTLRLNQPHILRGLRMYTFYQLPVQDIISILKCLIAQILMYPSIKDVIEERIESTAKARFELRNLCAAERRRETSAAGLKKQLHMDLNSKIAEFEGTLEEKQKLKMELEENLQRSIKRVDDVAEREKNTFLKAFAEYRQKIFAYQLYLGSDRAYRSYWLFESLPGLFVEHEPFSGKCIEQSVQNIAELANCDSANRKRCIKKLLREQLKANNKENKSSDPTDVNLDPAAPIVIKDERSGGVQSPNLIMCKGNRGGETCPVHSVIDTNRVTWSFIHTEDELNALTNSLNCRGFREKHLKEQLETEKDLIVNHITKCPSEQLQVPIEERDSKLNQLLQMKHYANANLKFDSGSDVGYVMEQSLVWNILEFEMEMYTGHLGALQVKNRLDWRTALELFKYDMQCDYIEWGPAGQFHRGNKKINGTAVNNSNSVLKYEDPGDGLGSTIDITEDDTMDDLISLHDSPDLKVKVENYSAAVLQLAYAIEPKFLKEPFGANKEYKDKTLLQKIMESGRRNFDMWTVSLMDSRSFSSIFLHYNILSDAVKWSKSSCNATCIFCRRKSEPNKMILCDGCNCGKHLFCFKPKLTAVPEGDWFCDKCKPPEKKPAKKPVAKKREIFKIDSDNELSSMSGDEDDQDNSLMSVDQFNNRELEECVRCFKPGRIMAVCAHCASRYHFKCTKPILKTMPMKSWCCTKKCSDKRAQNKKEMKKTKSSANGPQTSDYNGIVINGHDESMEYSDEKSDDENSEQPLNRPQIRNMSNNSKRINDADRSVENRRQMIRKKQAKRKIESTDSDSDNEILANTKIKIQAQIHSGTSQIADGNDDSDVVCPRQNRIHIIITSDDSDDEPIAKKVKAQTKISSIFSSDSENSDEDVPLGRQNHKRKDNKQQQKNKQNKNKNEKKNNKRASLRLSNEVDRRTSSGRSQRNKEHLMLDNIVLHNLIDDIHKHKDAWPFLRPVSKHDVPDYYIVIQNPMDFARIKSKLNMGSYSSNYDFMNDIQLVFSNCDLYNTDTSSIYKAGVSLERFVKQRCTDLNLPFKPSDMLSEEPSG